MTGDFLATVRAIHAAGDIPETGLPCGHTINWCHECWQEAERRHEYETACAGWDRPGVEFAASGGDAVHRAGVCVPGPSRVSYEDWCEGFRVAEPLTRAEAEAWLRQSYTCRPCRVCRPDIERPRWVKDGGRWRLAGGEQ
jgi:hypothetical protein